MLYAGIGSRKTPSEVLDYMRRVAGRLAARGYMLRSGAADGADAAFEEGCLQAGGQLELWLPWKGFNGRHGQASLPTLEHFGRAASLHPAWRGLSDAVQRLHARNVGQILGADLDTPVSFVVCWTADGCESAAQRTRETGGTGTAIQLASEIGVPVINLANPGAKERLAEIVLRSAERAAAEVLRPS